jgi:hypothetical protein
VDVLRDFTRELHPLLKICNAVSEVLLDDFSQRLYMLKIYVVDQAA